MKRVLLIVLLAGLLPVRGQDDGGITLDDVIQTAQDFARDNLDPEVLRNLPELDQQKIRDFLALIQKELHGEYVVDLAPLKDAARLILPLLESRAETQPYAAWLKARLDYSPRGFGVVSTNMDIFPIAELVAVFKSKSGKTTEGELYAPLMDSKGLQISK